MITILAIENHPDKEIDSLCNKYIQRTSGPFKLQLELIPAARTRDPELQKVKESENILKAIKTGDILILCDENGESMQSIPFSNFIEKKLSQSRGRLVFAIGGAHGFSKELLDKYNSIRLTDFTLPHHLARLVLVEQIYRAFEINKGSGYHHI
ncbi:MAG: 23S rRNA (pseudouridine(1915)-N(3))-methyltransferase RlmH [Bacteroidetes bacterium]|nr:23S rRNA (pseudouridine(1915)-N(3))-methyltransferase RlmH [Bacteroidota bacterium]